MSSKAEEEETAPIGPQSAYRREGSRFNKRKDHKNESNAQTFHSCTITHCMTHCIKYMFSYLKEERRMKKSLPPDKSFRKTFEEKEVNSNRLEFSKNSES